MPIVLELVDQIVDASQRITNAVNYDNVRCPLF